jgi:hypothetical protein
MWLGYNLASWVRLLVRNRFAVDFSRLHIALIVSVTSIHHSALGLLERLIYGRRIARTQVHPSPIFVLGHWRSGTTLLHELFACDPRLGYPDTYECFAPHHFLLTSGWVPRWFPWSLPQRRPMDNMPVGWQKPQEDEFALCLLGQPSPLAHVAFPNRIGPNDPSLHVECMPSSARRRWQTALVRFMRRLTLAHSGKQLVLKSPPHLCRIPLLLEAFPEARFVHIVRDPYAIYPSTLKLWRTLYAHHSLQRPNWRGLREHILSTFETMFESFEHHKKQIPPGRLYEIRFEDLLHDPISHMKKIYEALDLGDFEPARGPMEAYLASVRDYEGNQFMLTVEEEETISKRWASVFERYGYANRKAKVSRELL